MDRKLKVPLHVKSHAHEIFNRGNEPASFIRQWSQLINKIGDRFFGQYGFLIFMLGLLLGRAIILEELSPFACAYFAVIYHFRRDKSHFAFLGLLFGGVFSLYPHGWPLFLSIGCFFILQRLFISLGRSEITYAPFLVLFATFMGGLSHLYFSTGEIPMFQFMMRGIEAVLAMVLTFIFIQSLPIFLTKRKSYELKQEEIICLLILFASIMTGTVGLMVEGYSIEHIFTRYMILILALIGGGTMGATVGVVTGLILSLADVKSLEQMSFLGFSGLLAGIFREGKKVGVSLGLIMGISILMVYIGDQSAMWTSMVETLIAVSLFLLTPRSIITELAKFIPGTREYIDNQQAYVQRVKELTAERVLLFSDVFRQLSKSFSQTSLIREDLDEIKTDYFLSAVTDKTCQRCWKKEKCWSRQFEFTYRHMRSMMDHLEQSKEISKRDIDPEWRDTCIRLDKLILAMEEENSRRLQEQHLNRRITEARHLVADQLYGVAQVMVDFSKEIKKEGQEMGNHERQILDALQGLGLQIQTVEIYSLNPGKIDIRLSQPSCSGRKECAKLIAPLISDILDEHVVVLEQGCQVVDGLCQMQLTSGKDYEVKIGMAQAAKGGGLISGDSYTNLDLGNGKYAIALSDGMGNGSRAFTESSATLHLLQQILQSGLDEKLAIKTVNSVLSLRSTDEVFSTVDLALIDLYHADTKFLKIGSSPSFIKSGDYVRTVTAHNLPIGILDEIEFDVVNEQLKAGDLLIMVTDGIYEANRDVENRDLWLKRMIREIETDEPQEVADLLLERVIRSLQNQILDDMTVVVARIDHFTPQWSTISLPNMPKIHTSHVAQ